MKPIQRPSHLPKPRRQSPQPVAGSGALAFAGMLAAQGGPGLVAQDARATGFAARITAQATITGTISDTLTNAYGFAEVDEFDPTFPEFDGGRFGDGTQLAAYERLGRTDVPTDGSAVVWLEPLLGGIGYGFTYRGASAVHSTAPDFVIGTEGDSGYLLVHELALPSAGTYLVFGQATAVYNVTDFGPSPDAYITATLQVEYPDGGIEAAKCLAAFPKTFDLSREHQATANLGPLALTVDGPRTARLRARRWGAAPGTWATSFLGGVYLGYLKVG